MTILRQQAQFREEVHPWEVMVKFYSCKSFSGSSDPRKKCVEKNAMYDIHMYCRCYVTWYIYCRKNRWMCAFSRLRSRISAQ